MEYKLEGYNLFLEMMANIRRNTIYNVYMFQPAKVTLFIFFILNIYLTVRSFLASRTPCQNFLLKHNFSRVCISCPMHSTYILHQSYMNASHCTSNTFQPHALSIQFATIMYVCISSHLKHLLLKHNFSRVCFEGCAELNIHEHIAPCRTMICCAKLCCATLCHAVTTT